MFGRTALVVTLWLAGLCLVACATPAPTAAPLTEPTPLRVEVPVTVEVTRVITQAVVLAATPIPPAPCVPPLEATNVITVGAIVPLSLPGSMMAGFAMQTALALSVQEINARGGVAGRTLALALYDSAGQAERGRSGVERLVLDDCVAGVVGVYHSSVALSAAEASHQYGTPLIIAGAIGDEITELHHPEVFRISATRSLLVQMPARWLGEVGDHNQDGRIAAVVIGENAANSVELSRVIEAFDAESIDAQLLTVDLPATDFASAVARLVSMESVPDAIFIYLKGAPALDLLQQVLAAGIGPQKSTVLVLQRAGLDSGQFWQTVPEGTGTVVARIGPWPSTVTTQGQQFALAYGQYAAHWPEDYAFAARDAVYLFVDAIERAQSLDGAALVATLEDTDLELAAGHYTFPYGSLNPPDGISAPLSMWHQWPAVPTLYLQYAERSQPADALPVIWPQLYRTVDAPLVR